MDKEILIENFVGSKYNKLYNKNFSIWALIFGWCYFVYRKMLLAGFGFLILQTAISSLFNTLNKPIVIISYLLINLALSLLFNSMYRNHVQKKVNIIIVSSKNEEEAIKKSIKKGGTSVSWVIVSIITTIILMIIFTLIYGIIFVVNSTVDFVKDNTSITEESLKKNTITILENGGHSAFGGAGNIDNYITYKIDEKFKQDDFSDDEYIYESGNGIFDEITFKIFGYKNIIISDEAKKQFKEEKKIINGKEWTIYKYVKRDKWTQVNENGETIEKIEEIETNEEEYEINIFAVLKVKDLNIIIKYIIEEDVEDKQEALRELDNILNSIQYK